MAPVVGIPRALAYHDYFPFWQAFFRVCDVKTIISPPTNKAIVDAGVRQAVDGTCFPVKILFGHAHWLLRQDISALFLPRIVSVVRKEYICPKFMGLPDMIRTVHSGDWQCLRPIVNLNLPPRHLRNQMRELGRALGSSARQIQRGYEAGSEALRAHRQALLQGNWPHWCKPPSIHNGDYSQEASAASANPPDLAVGLLGHSYLVYDQYANMGITAKLMALGVRIMTVDMVAPERIAVQVRAWPKSMFWTSSRRILGAAGEYMTLGMDGIIYITAFGCGTDSLTAELVENAVRRTSTIPQMILNVDEHTGEAGILTRLEAFVDMLRWRSKR